MKKLFLYTLIALFLFPMSFHQRAFAQQEEAVSASGSKAMLQTITEQNIYVTSENL